MKTPQQLSREAIDEFKSHYKEEFGEDLSNDEVQEMALRLLKFLKFLLEPDSSPSPNRPPITN